MLQFSEIGVYNKYITVTSNSCHSIRTSYLGVHAYTAM